MNQTPFLILRRLSGEKCVECPNARRLFDCWLASPVNALALRFVFLKKCFWWKFSCIPENHDTRCCPLIIKRITGATALWVSKDRGGFKKINVSCLLWVATGVWIINHDGYDHLVFAFWHALLPALWLAQGALAEFHVSYLLHSSLVDEAASRFSIDCATYL